MVLSFVFLTNAPIATFGPLIARKFITTPGLSWRWAYYINISKFSISPHSELFTNYPSCCRIGHHSAILLLSSTNLQPSPWTQNKDAIDQAARLHRNLLMDCRSNPFLDGCKLGWYNLSMEACRSHIRNSHRRRLAHRFVHLRVNGQPPVSSHTCQILPKSWFHGSRRMCDCGVDVLLFGCPVMASASASTVYQGCDICRLALGKFPVRYQCVTAILM
jgi:hypothetical protein